MEKICFTGFMGSGKTTIGQALAKQLDCSWEDLDSFIEKKAGCPISQYFKMYGEPSFRKLEAGCLEELLASETKIISTGGGVITTPQNIASLKKVKTIFLDYPFEELYERIKGDHSRPLVTTYQELQQRYEERYPYYKAASCIRISCSQKSIQDVIKEILAQL